MLLFVFVSEIWPSFFFAILLHITVHRLENGEFEPLEITPYSSPPDLPDVMKNQDSANGQETTHIAS